MDRVRIRARVQPAESAFTRAPIFDNVLSRISPATLIRLGRCSRTTQDAVANYSSRAFNINKHLSRYFPDPVAFRSLQARTATLISGSSALQFFDRTLYPESDLDLYTFHEHGKEVGRWLQERGYEFAPKSSQAADFNTALGEDGFEVDDDGTDYRLKGVKGIFFFERPSQEGGEPLKVQIITASTTPLECVLNFHCTVVMNVIAFDAAYAFYPLSTYEERRALATDMNTARRETRAIALGKYARRGWRIQATLYPFEGRNGVPPFYPNLVRWVGDRQTWTIPLDTTGIQRPSPVSVSSEPFTWDPVLHNSWILNSYARITYNTTKSMVLKYQYLVADKLLLDELINFFVAQGKLEHLKVSSEEGAFTDTWKKTWTW
ncbi:hypothetical protein JAAARDRAFT_199333 [Jaapia argillacea MUCL 33604]|uniref:Uncharacterized protein n=1 Tax=Jaapia argillacea MUCL 33604 TaxID=933084 RepID=A0A067P8L6_9AGAM|nr:hypothetical protein JAAARDRAFT_199333 [Jaapia argillacea MUCL 33604]